MIPEHQFLGIEHAGLDPGGFTLSGPGQLLGHTAIGATLLFVLHSVRVGVPEVPNAAALP